MTRDAKDSGPTADSKNAAPLNVHLVAFDSPPESGPGYVREISWNRALLIELHKVSFEEFSDMPCVVLAQRQFVLHKNQRAYHVVFRTSLHCTKESEIVVDGKAFPLDWTPETPEMKRFEEKVNEEWCDRNARLSAYCTDAISEFETRIRRLEDSHLRLQKVAGVGLSLLFAVAAVAVLVFLRNLSLVDETVRDAHAAMNAAHSATAIASAQAARVTDVESVLRRHAMYLGLAFAAACAACGATLLLRKRK